MKALVVLCAGGALVLLIVAVVVVGVTNPMTTTMNAASQRLVRISQLDPMQYASQPEFTTWSPSTCSAASMTEVLNAYGKRVRIADVLHVEVGLHEISPELGMLHPEAIQRTVATFGFNDMHRDYMPDNPAGLDQLIAVGNAGYPVIVGFPPPRWAGGHLLVLLGGDAKVVHLADSSRLNLKWISHAQFLQWWGGSADIITPKQTAQPTALPSQSWPNSPYVQSAWNAALTYHLLSPTYFVAQINQESHFNAQAQGPLVYVSGQPMHAQGIAQLLPTTASCIERTPKGGCYSVNPWKPEEALPAAAYLMEKSWIAYLKQSPGDPLGAYQKALASYNAGSGAVDTAIKRCRANWLACLPAETQQYVSVILAA